jgi:hypothetical protein
MCGSVAVRLQDKGFIEKLEIWYGRLGGGLFVTFMCNSVAKRLQDKGFIEQLNFWLSFFDGDINHLTTFTSMNSVNLGNKTWKAQVFELIERSKLTKQQVVTLFTRSFGGHLQCGIDAIFLDLLENKDYPTVMIHGKVLHLTNRKDRLITLFAGLTSTENESLMKSKQNGKTRMSFLVNSYRNQPGCVSTARQLTDVDEAPFQQQRNHGGRRGNQKIKYKGPPTVKVREATLNGTWVRPSRT